MTIYSEDGPPPESRPKSFEEDQGNDTPLVRVDATAAEPEAETEAEATQPPSPEPTVVTLNEFLRVVMHHT